MPILAGYLTQPPFLVTRRGAASSYRFFFFSDYKLGFPFVFPFEARLMVCFFVWTFDGRSLVAREARTM